LEKNEIGSLIKLDEKCNFDICSEPDRVTVSVTLQLMVSESVSESVSQPVLALSPSGTRDQILAVVKTVAVLSWGVLPVERTGLPCNRSQFLSIL